MADEVTVRRFEGATGRLDAERLTRSDDTTGVRFGVDAGGPARVEVTSSDRVTDFEEEEVAARSVALAINEKWGTAYFVKSKEQEDYEYVDRFLILGVAGEKAIPLQIRHADDRLVGELKATLAAKQERTVSQACQIVQAAIDAKANIDPSFKAKTHLALILGFPIGELFGADLLQHSFDDRGFAAIWLCPFCEPAILLAGS